ncbi:acyl-CoA thioesterase-2 [Pseudoclavibacter chungangensis]|nr:acyl-CoA thioesterase-2 [Pseudoclavibacter chungangensis]
MSTESTSSAVPEGWLAEGTTVGGGALEQLPPLDAFLRTLDLTDTGARTSNDIFTGPSQWMPNGRVFGGQVAAQSLVAAMRTIETDRPVHSMHGYFLRPGDIAEPITFAVDRIHDGNSFSTRSVRAYQYGHVIWSMIASFQTLEGGLEHAATMPEGIPGPEELPSEAEALQRIDPRLAEHWVHRRPFEMRHVQQPVYVQPAEERATGQAVWMRTVAPLPDDPLLHQAAIAYVSDYTMLEPLLRAHGIAWMDSRLRVASLDHAVWWHRAARADEWLLFVESSPSASGGRGLTLGNIFTRTGELVATVAQEGMVRLKTAPAATTS